MFLRKRKVWRIIIIIAAVLIIALNGFNAGVDAIESSIWQKKDAAIQSSDNYFADNVGTLLIPEDKIAYSDNPGAAAIQRNYVEGYNEYIKEIQYIISSYGPDSFKEVVYYSIYKGLVGEIPDDVSTMLIFVRTCKFFRIYDLFH
ncbi:hypothetical protein [Butyrivibrio sp. MB2005]|uniref:hypothetical protein n=1 Tax=Butyrivibrio sp. MB2005 TaxID=1280678 RepID=UPI000426645F|nr:hypothetical protein [Butyrivibrio sp. MB2005]